MILKKISEMNRILMFILLVVAQIPVIAQTRMPAPRERYIYENADGTYNWYVIDTLKFEKTTLIQDKYYGTYLLPKEVDIDTLSMKKLLTQPDSFIIYQGITDLWGMYFVSLEEWDQFDDTYIIPVNGDIRGREGRSKRNIKQWSKDKEYFSFQYSVTPSMYIFFLMTGKVYNYRTYKIVWDGPVLKPIDFPDENAYYKILVPVWKKAMP